MVPNNALRRDPLTHLGKRLPLVLPLANIYITSLAHCYSRTQHHQFIGIYMPFSSTVSVTIIDVSFYEYNVNNNTLYIGKMGNYLELHMCLNVYDIMIYVNTV